METMLIILAVTAALTAGFAIGDWLNADNRRQLRRLRRHVERLQEQVEIWSRVPKVTPLLLLAAGAMLFGSSARGASVDLTYDLNAGSFALGCPGGSCGQLTISGDTATALNITTTLAPGGVFYGNGGSAGTGTALYMNLIGGPFAFSDLSPGGTLNGVNFSFIGPLDNPFAVGPQIDPGVVPGWGAFEFLTLCTADVDGKLCGTPLHFSVTGSTGLDALLPFVVSVNFNGLAGLVGGTLEATDPTPLPSALILFGSVLVGAAGLYRSRRKKPAVSAAA